MARQSGPAAAPPSCRNGGQMAHRYGDLTIVAEVESKSWSMAEPVASGAKGGLDGAGGHAPKSPQGDLFRTPML
eukprot:6213271-Pleurochrysis_carterae.AAC.5